MSTFPCGHPMTVTHVAQACASIVNKCSEGESLSELSQNSDKDKLRCSDCLDGVTYDFSICSSFKGEGGQRGFT